MGKKLGCGIDSHSLFFVLLYALQRVIWLIFAFIWRYAGIGGISRLNAKMSGLSRYFAITLADAAGGMVCGIPRLVYIIFCLLQQAKGRSTSARWHIEFRFILTFQNS